MFETYPKQTCRNHAWICGPNGKQILSVPVNKPSGNHTLTRDVRCDNSVDWQRIHWRAIETAYSNSPYFLYYQDYFRIHYQKKYDFLADVNSEILDTIFRLMHFQRDWSFTQTWERQPAELTDLRLSLTAKHATAECPPYTQTFMEKLGFFPNLSVLDVLFNLGPESPDYLLSVN